MPRSTSSSVRSRIGRATSVEEIVHSLAKRGCFDLTSSIDLDACSKFPRAGGGYCDVYRGTLHNGTSIAIKTLRIYDGPEAEQDSNSRKILKRAARELYHWSKLQHCNVLPLMGLAVFRGQISMISKWMENGCLTSFLRLNQDANRPTICVDICEGLCYIHANGVVHGDLKGANVMVAPEGTAMIADFGNTRLKDLTLRFSTTAKSGYSIRWAAPELLLEDSGPQVSKEADVYAYGMTVLEVLTGKVPYEGIGDNRILILVAVEKKVPTRPSVNMPDDLWNLLNSCWNREPSKRPKIARVRESLQVLSWFPSDTQLTKGTTPDQTQPKFGGSVEGPRQVRGSGNGPSRFVPPIMVDRPPPIPESRYSTKNNTNTTTKNSSYTYATATPVTPVNQQPPIPMPSPEPWNDPSSSRRRADAEDAALIAHARALEQARKLAAGEDDDEEEEEETRRYMRSKFGDQGQNYSDDEEEESTEESSSEETESSISDRQQRQASSLEDLQYPHRGYDYPHRDRDNQSEASSVPAITINSPSNDSNLSSVMTRITDEDRRNEPLELGMESLENEPLDYDEFFDSPNRYGQPPSPSAAHYNVFPAPYDGVPSSKWSRSPGMGLQPPGFPDFTGFDGELDSLKNEPTNDIPTRSNPSRNSDRSPGANYFRTPDSAFSAEIEARLAEVGWSFENLVGSVPDPVTESALAPASSPYGRSPRAKEQEAKKTREQELEMIREQEFEKARQRELEKERERERRREERERERARRRQLYQPAPAVPIVHGPSPPPRLSRRPSPAKQIRTPPASEGRHSPSPVTHIISPPLHIALPPPHAVPPSRVVEQPARIVEGPSKPWSYTAETPITPATSQPRGHDEMRSKKTAPMIKIKSTTRAQVEAFRALQLERQRTPDLSDGEQSAERNPSPSVRRRKSRAVTVVSTSDEDDWTTGRLLKGKPL